MHKSKIILLILVLGLTTYLSCDTFKGPDLKLSTDKEEIPAGGNDHAVITATLKKQGDPEANQQIEFETTNGSFSTNEEQNEVVATTNSEGIATVKLYSAPQQGQATVTATYKDD
ncbi:MAG: Ig-like domain-containing protein, partial [Myxococcota bacterium]